MALEPEPKKVKLTATITGIDEDKSDMIPRSVLADEYTREVQTVQVYAAEIKDRKQTSTLLRQLKDLFPLANLGHLKRIRCCQSEKEAVLQIILCLAEENKEYCSPLNKFFQGLDLPVGRLGQPFVADVPKSPPLTRIQFDQASKLWPVNFHEDKYITKLVGGELFDREAVQNIIKFMRMAIAAAKNSCSKVPIGAVIVDPQKNHPIAVSHDIRCRGHPLQHAVMVCIDLVAHSQSQGAWQLDCEESNGTWVLANNASEAPVADGGCCSTSKPVLHDEGTLDPNNTDGKEKSGPYLCTGYDLYVTREPCVMCAMALVHSRIRRVFYSCSDSGMGALGSKYKIHTKPGLNHHFEVFCGILEDEATKSTTL